MLRHLPALRPRCRCGCLIAHHDVVIGDGVATCRGCEDLCVAAVPRPPWPALPLDWQNAAALGIAIRIYRALNVPRRFDSCRHSRPEATD